MNVLDFSANEPDLKILKQFLTKEEVHKFISLLGRDSVTKIGDKYIAKKHILHNESFCLEQYQDMFASKLRSFLNFENYNFSENFYLKYNSKSAGTNPHIDGFNGGNQEHLYNVWINLYSYENISKLMILKDSSKLPVKNINDVSNKFVEYLQINNKKIPSNFCSISEDTGMPWYQFELSSGDAVFFNSNYIHGTVPNKSNFLRISLDFRFSLTPLKSIYSDYGVRYF